MNEYKQKFRVYIEDTDCGGIVYHANYLKYMERARTDFMRDYGYEHTTAEKEGYILVVANMNIAFKASAKMDDLLDVSVIVKKVGKSAFDLVQNIYREGELLISAEIKIAAIATTSGKLCRMPDGLIKNLKSKMAQ